MADSLGIALVGCGTVGTGVVSTLLQHSRRMTRRAGRPLELRRIIVHELRKPRDPLVPLDLLDTDLGKALVDPKVDVIVELMGGTTTAREVVLSALEHGKHVVTANKALLAAHGPEVFAKARKCQRVICFEAAVAGGIPIIRALAESLTANQVTSIQAILNGTSNFILSSMAERGISYAEALKEAQDLGYAEADPTLDVDGSDAAHKLAILAQIAFGVTALPHQIEKYGIETIDALDIRFANELGYTIKLLAEAWASAKLIPESSEERKTVALHVAPVLLRQTDMLAQVRGAYNAIQLVGDVVGETLYQGPGAGMHATASAVVADLLDIAIGRAQVTFAAAKLWSEAGVGFTVEPSEKVKSRFYLRLMVLDQPGVLADVCRMLAAEGISISSMIQHEAIEGQPDQAIPLMIMTHYAQTGKFRAAITAINRLPSVVHPAIFYSVDD